MEGLAVDEVRFHLRDITEEVHESAVSLIKSDTEATIPDIFINIATAAHEVQISTPEEDCDNLKELVVRCMQALYILTPRD